MPLGLFLEKLYPTPEGAQTIPVLKRYPSDLLGSVTTGTVVVLVGGRASIER